MSQHAEMGSAPTTSAIACSAVAERMRAHRRRRRAGLRLCHGAVTRNGNRRVNPKKTAWKLMRVTISMPSAMPCTLISITHCVQRSDAQQDNERALPKRLRRTDLFGKISRETIKYWVMP